MPRPTIAEIRRRLDDLGLNQVDPSAWFDGTMPEILRAMIDMGPVSPLPTVSLIQNLTFASAANLFEVFDITAAEDGTIRVVKNLTIDIVTETINEIRLQQFDAITNVMWRDASALFGIGQYIGRDNDETRAWGALGLDNIVLYPRELTDTPGIVPRRLQLRLQSGAAEVKTVTVSMTLIDFNSRLFNGGDW